MICLCYGGLFTSVWKRSGVTISKPQCFLTFSMVLPYTLLFVNLNKPFSKSLLAFFMFSMLSSMMKRTKVGRQRGQRQKDVYEARWAGQADTSFKSPSVLCPCPCHSPFPSFLCPSRPGLSVCLSVCRSVCLSVCHF